MKRADKLDHRKYKYSDMNALIREIEGLCDGLDQKHPMERKIRFLLDIRGYLKVNGIRGSYIEFGSYHSEMQYAAYNVLDETGMMDSYVGLEIFSGEPELTPEEKKSFPAMCTGDFSCDHEAVLSFVENNFGGKGVIVKGDFRKKEVMARCDAHLPLSVAVIDCNLLSSTEYALKYTLKNMTPGGVIFIDDYLSNMSGGIPRVKDLFEAVVREEGKEVLEHNFYPPFAKSFIAVGKQA
ncbi:MAG: hypothetical protein ABIG55_03555 [Candidatus Omnitrophota bacterium]